jgi:hypothetical protein
MIKERPARKKERENGSALCPHKPCWRSKIKLLSLLQESPCRPSASSELNVVNPLWACHISTTMTADNFDFSQLCVHHILSRTDKRICIEPFYKMCFS